MFDRYPGLFYFRSKGPKGAKLDFYLVPLHLKAMDEGHKRRSMASAILGAAIRKMIDQEVADADWIVGGDFNAALASRDFQPLMDKGMTAISAEDEARGAFSYLKRPRSLIDHVFLSSNLTRTYGPKDYYIVAQDRNFPGFAKDLSDHRPVVARLSLGSGRKQRPSDELDSGALRELKESLRIGSTVPARVDGRQARPTGARTVR